MERIVMESLDFLWFYSNVFSSRAYVVSDSSSVEEEHVIEEVLKQVLQFVEDQKNEPGSEAGDLIPVTPKCAEAAMSMSTDHVVEVVEYYCQSQREKEQRRRRSRSKRGMQRNRRRILGVLALGLHVKSEASGCHWIFLEEDFGYRNPQLFNLNDNMAMKEHLKTWAYAVACTVR